MDELELTQLEQFVLAEDKESFIKKLIPDTEEHYYFSLLYAINRYGTELPKEYKHLFTKFNKFKSYKSKAISIRYLLKQYEEAKTEEAKKKVVKKINNKIFKLKFNHDAPNQAMMENQDLIKPQNLANLLRNNKPTKLSKNKNNDDDDDEEEENDDSKSGNSSDREIKVPTQKTEKGQKNKSADDQTDSDGSEPEEQRKNPPTNCVDDEVLKLDYAINQAYKSYQNFSCLKKDYYINLDLKKFVANNTDANKIRTLLDNHTICELSNEDLVMLIQHYVQLCKEKSVNFKFDLYSVIFRCTLEQMEFLYGQNSLDFSSNKDFISLFYQKKFYKPISEEEEDKILKLKELKEQYEWSKTLSAKFKNFSDQILYEYLQQGFKANQYDFDMFTLYLKNPKEMLQNMNQQQQKTTPIIKCNTIHPGILYTSSRLVIGLNNKSLLTNISQNITKQRKLIQQNRLTNFLMIIT
eukprot:TRINITY_DN1517_c0_g1_i2.p1 TRINITY_DN1517_c0_g1~~TRINITY_DN1517_c0_g1_i2.p1  ORF type:complete len:466 (-),score=102.79 TRINITY_DN1517_c0_g1_i2:970-2367(-)